MQKTKVIFLDIDGPMISQRAAFLPNQTGIHSVFDPCAQAMLNRLLEDDANIKIVISSSWGKLGRHRIVALFEKNGIDVGRLHDDWITPREYTEVRTLQIKQWLDAHPEVEEWCALDDEMLDCSILPGFVLCDTANGMSYRNYIECRYYLGLTNTSGPSKDEHDRDKHRAVINLYKRYEVIRTSRQGERMHDTVKRVADQMYPLIEVDDDCD